MKYKKIGKGKVLKCWESKIQRFYEGRVREDELICTSCENVIGMIVAGKGNNYVKMNQNEFTYTGTKID